MRVLVVGGSGHVGALALPEIARLHDVRVFDLRAPDVQGVEYVEGNVNDLAALVRAADGAEALLYMAMGAMEWRTHHGIETAFDVNVKGVYHALYAAHEAGARHAVYTSSMSVYENLNARYFPDEEITPDARQLYGFSKRMGEEVCRNAAREWGMTVNALRLCLPRSDEQWLMEAVAGTPTIATTATDVARALLAALDYRGGGFQAFMISGDYEQRVMNMTKAKRLLGWEPLARPVRKE